MYHNLNQTWIGVIWMNVTAEEREREHERDLERVAMLRIIDDDFMRCVFRDRPDLVQDTLRTITQMDEIVVVRSETQRDLKRIAGARSVELDVWAIDSDGSEYDMEVQRGRDANPRRARYNAACMDVETLDSGHKPRELPDQWVIFVMEEDPFDEGEGTYVFERMRGNKPLGDGRKVLYVNGAYRGDDELGSLMHDFCETDPAKMNNRSLAKRVEYWKKSAEGVRQMCEMLEKMRDEAMERGLEQGLEQGLERGLEQGLERRAVEDVRSLMETLQITAQQALDALKVPQADQARLLSLI